MNTYTTETGDIVITRSDDSSDYQSVIWPRTAIDSLEDLKGAVRLALLDAVKDYFFRGHAVIPCRLKGLIMPVLRMIIHETESEQEMRRQQSRAKSNAGKTRWKDMYDTGQVTVTVPAIGVPPQLKGKTFKRGGIDIPIDEVLQVAGLFLLRGFAEAEVRHFFLHYARNSWDHGAIMTAEDRRARAQYWRQFNGSGRFDDDDAAQELFATLLSILPEEKRGYLLASGCRASKDADGMLLLSLPEEIHDCFQADDAQKALAQYCRIHGYDTTKASLVSIPFVFSV